MKVVIVGGNGFLGKSITNMLKLRLEANVIALSRSSMPSLNIAHPISQEVLDACKDAKVIINCTGILYPTANNTFDGVQNIAALATKSNAQFIHFSAIGADATSTIAYARTKGLGELAALKECENTTIFRPSIVFGRGDQFFNRFAELAKYMPFLPVFGDGSSKPIYVEDISECVIKAIGNPACKGMIIELGGPKVYTYKELMQLTLDSAGMTRPILPLPWIVGAIQGYFLEKLPVNLFTVTGDQVKLLKSDNIVSKGAMTAADLDVSLTNAEDVLSTWMKK